MAHHEHYPYTLEEWARDVRRWCFATKVTEERQANLLALALGGSARSLVDEISEDLLRDGGDADFGDGRGREHKTGFQLLYRALELKFPTDREAQMLRAGI